MVAQIISYVINTIKKLTPKLGCFKIIYFVTTNHTFIAYYKSDLLDTALTLVVSWAFSFQMNKVLQK
jgi:hypothetical protein